jgi:Cys-rich protein (TIGR01571 family)
LISPAASSKKNDDPHNIPVGRWRDGLCDCCVLGCCHAHLCLACFCGTCALGQVMTRMNLSPFAEPYIRGTSHTRRWTTCGILSVVALVMCIGLNSLAMVVTPHPYVDEDGVIQPDPTPPSPFWRLVYHLLLVSWVLYILLAICKTRAYVRQTYGIPETSCRGCEDCCCTFWCGCCTITQMARHTADYRTYHGACCSSTGLGEGAPPTLAPHLV